jgi:hypothetical protein
MVGGLSLGSELSGGKAMIVNNFRRPACFIGGFGIFGLILLPVLFYALSETVPDYQPFPFQFLLWPSSLGFMGLERARPWDSDWIVGVAIMASMNGVLYGAIGTLLWLGLFKWRWMLIVLVGGLAWGLYQFVDTFYWDLKVYWDVRMGQDS